MVCGAGSDEAHQERLCWEVTHVYLQMYMLFACMGWQTYP